MQSIQQLNAKLAADIARIREIPDDNSEIPTGEFSRRLAAESAARESN